MLKKTIGYTLFTWSFVGWGLTLVVPFAGLTPAMLATVVTGLIVTAEVAFALSLLLLGREFWQRIKGRFIRNKGSND